MPNVRNILPKDDRGLGAGRALRPFTHSMEEFWEDSFPRRWMEGLFDRNAWKMPPLREFGETMDVWPRIDVLDNDDALIVRAEMPGVKKKDLEITIAGNRLTFEANREFEEKEEKEGFYRSEIAHGRMFRVVHLPVEVRGDDVKAEMKDGIIEVHLPKVEAITPHKVKVA